MDESGRKLKQTRISFVGKKSEEEMKGDKEGTRGRHSEGDI